MTAKCKFILFNGLLLIAMTGTSALAGAFDFMYPEKESNHAAEVDFALDFINWVTVISFVGIIVVMVWFAIRYRRREPGQRAESQVSHSTSLELVWSVPPIIVVAIIFWLGFAGFMEMTTPPENAYQINVEAYQFGWQFTHPNGNSKTNVLDVPADEPVRLIMQSRDTIHSLYVPAFRVKQDVLQGRFTSLWFIASNATDHADYVVPEAGPELDELASKGLALQVEKEMRANRQRVTDEAVAAEVATRFGNLEAKANASAAKTAEQEKLSDENRQELETQNLIDSKKELAKSFLESRAAENGYILFCTELCGELHSQMLARVVVHEKGWRAPAVELPKDPIKRGKFYFDNRGCLACHDNPAMAAAGYPQFITEGVWGKTQRFKDGSTLEISGDKGEEYLLNSILQPAANVVATAAAPMPQQGVTEEEAKFIVQYLKTLEFKGQ